MITIFEMWVKHIVYFKNTMKGPYLGCNFNAILRSSEYTTEFKTEHTTLVHKGKGKHHDQIWNYGK